MLQVFSLLCNNSLRCIPQLNVLFTGFCVHRRAEKRKPEDGDGGGDDKPADAQGDTDFLKSKRSKLGDDVLRTRTGGAYIPPARLKMMQAEITDKKSQAFQRLAWESLKKSLNGLINKVNVSNLSKIIPELFQENLVRGR